MKSSDTIVDMRCQDASSWLLPDILRIDTHLIYDQNVVLLKERVRCKLSQKQPLRDEKHPGSADRIDMLRSSEKFDRTLAEFETL